MCCENINMVYPRQEFTKSLTLILRCDRSESDKRRNRDDRCRSHVSKDPIG